MNAFDDWRHRQWEHISRSAAIAWLAFYLLFLLYAFRNSGGFLLIDNANLVVHEAGHLLLGWLGETAGLYGGTLLQLIVPLVLGASFAWRKQTTASAFCAFLLFENFLYIATYMADARAQELPLVSVGSGESVDHDWHAILSNWGILGHDLQLAAAVRTIGWMGMVTTMAWLAWQAWQNGKRDQARSTTA